MKASNTGRRRGPAAPPPGSRTPHKSLPGRTGHTIPGDKYPRYSYQDFVEKSAGRLGITV